MYCQDCGQKNTDEARFCIKCGIEIVKDSTLSSPSLEPKQSSNPIFRDINQVHSPGNSIETHTGTELKDSGTVTAMSVVGFVFGLIGMMGSFIPCIGSLAFYVGIPAAIISGIGLGIANSQGAKKSFAIAALTISLIGVTISGWQYYSIISAGNQVERELKKMFNKPIPSQIHVPVQKNTTRVVVPDNIVEFANIQRVTAMISNADDEAALYVNGTETIKTGWGKGEGGRSLGHQPGSSGWVDIKALLHPGTNELRFWVWNASGCCNVSGTFQVRIDDSQVISRVFNRQDAEEGVKYDETLSFVLK